MNMTLTQNDEYSFTQTKKNNFTCVYFRSSDVFEDLKVSNSVGINLSNRCWCLDIDTLGGQHQHRPPKILTQVCLKKIITLLVFCTVLLLYSSQIHQKYWTFEQNSAKPKLQTFWYSFFQKVFFYSDSSVRRTVVVERIFHANL